MSAHFDMIVVPLDLEDQSDRAIDVARALALLGELPIELVTVSSPGLNELTDLMGLEERAAAHRLGDWRPLVLHGNDPATALAEHLSGLAVIGSPIVVMASEAPGPLVELLGGSTSAELLARSTTPTLVIGPRVDPAWSPTVPTLLSCVDPEDGEAALPTIARWMHTFGGPPPRFVEVVEAGAAMATATSVSGAQAAESGLVRRLAASLAELGVTGEWDVLHDDDPVEALDRYAGGVPDGVLVVASARWAEHSHAHLHSVSRRLAHRSSRPVLVVPQ